MQTTHLCVGVCTKSVLGSSLAVGSAAATGEVGTTAGGTGGVASYGSAKSRKGVFNDGHRDEKHKKSK